MERNQQPAPSVCPNCSKPNPERLTSFPSTISKSTFYVYKCQCGYLFSVENVVPLGPSRPTT